MKTFIILTISCFLFSNTKNSPNSRSAHPHHDDHHKDHSHQPLRSTTRHPNNKTAYKSKDGDHRPSNPSVSLQEDNPPNPHLYNRFISKPIVLSQNGNDDHDHDHKDDDHDHKDDDHDHNDDDHDHNDDEDDHNDDEDDHNDDDHDHNDDDHDHHDHSDHTDEEDHDHDDHDHNHEQSETTLWIAITTSSTIVWSSSLIGAALPKRFVKKHNRKLLAFCVGTLLASIFGEFFPHAGSETIKLAETVGSHHALALFSWLTFAGVALAFALESAVHFTSQGHLHGHGGCGNDCEEASQPPKQAPPRADRNVLLCGVPPTVLIDLAAKIVHNFVDGALIGSMYSSELSAGVSISASILVHELSATVGAFSLYIFEGLSKTKAVLVCALGSLSIFAGSFLVGGLRGRLRASGALAYISFMALGIFIYLTFYDLLPLLVHEEHGLHAKEQKIEKSNVLKTSRRRKLLEIGLLVLSFAVGFGVMLMILYLMPHQH